MSLSSSTLLRRARIAGALAAACIASIAVGVSAASAAPGDPILVFTGNGSLNPGETYSGVASVAGRSISSTGTLPGSLSGNACVLLSLNQSTFSGPQVSALSTYLDGGGKVVMVGENDNYANNQAFRDLATALGSTMQIQNNSFDSGWHTTTNVDSDPLTQDVNSVTYAATATVTFSGTARSLLRRQGGTGTMIAAEQIGSGELIALGDANAFMAPTGDAGILVSNICGNRRNTSSATACLPANAPVGATVTCTTTVTDSDSGTAVTPTGDVAFTRAGAGSGTFANSGTCTLAPSGPPGTASCAITYVASAAGAQTLTGAYKGTFNSRGSSAGDAHTATLPTPPTAAGGQSSSAAGQPQTFSVSVPAGATLTLLDGTTPTNTYTVNGQGVYSLAGTTITFTPVSGFSGTAQAVTFRITDAYNQHSDATYVATVLAPPPTPEPPTTGPPVTPVAPGPVTLPEQVTKAGLTVNAGGGVGVPLSCPVGPSGCDADGTLSIALPSKKGVRASAAASETILARFSGVRIAAGESKLLTVRLDRATLRKLQAQKIRKVRATLRTNNHLAGASTVSSVQDVWLQVPATVKTCSYNRTLNVHWIVPRGTELRSVVITANGKTVVRPHVNTFAASVRLAADSPSVTLIRIVATTKDGKALSSKRLRVACGALRPSGYTPTKTIALKPAR